MFDKYTVVVIVDEDYDECDENNDGSEGDYGYWFIDNKFIDDGFWPDCVPDEFLSGAFEEDECIAEERYTEDEFAQAFPELVKS